MCGAVRFEYKYSDESKPVFSAYCHCSSCRKLGSCSMQHVIGVPAGSFAITKGQDVLKDFSPTDSKMYRKFCGDCGAGICQAPKGAPFVGTYPSTYDVVGKFPEGNRMPAELLPTCHINMENAVIGDVVKGDDLPKFKDFPPTFGGSGAMWEAPV